MKISVNWINDYIDIGSDPEKISEILSDLGFPCEGIENVDGDSIIDIEVTSNRGDCLGLVGVARELAAVSKKPLKAITTDTEVAKSSNQQTISVKIDSPEFCNRYTARLISGVKVGPSPDWLVQKLATMGMRSVNNIVDATNYVMAETGQPSHAFDFDKIAGNKIIVRKASAGEKIISIDATDCKLSPDMLIIADSNKPIAIAGVMGGLDTEVSEATTTILLEVAHFDPVTVRTASRRLALQSEASFRFERIVDVEKIPDVSDRILSLIGQLAHGEIASELVDIYPVPKKSIEVKLRLSRLNKILGIEIDKDTSMDILSTLCFEPRLDGETIVCSVPSWRSDVTREVDLIEEVIRVYGYGKIPVGKEIKIEVAPVDARQKLIEKIGTYFSGCGFYESINVTFVDDKIDSLFADDKKPLAVKDVTRKSANKLRQSLLGSLMGVLQTNVNAGNVDCCVYEVADTFIASGELLPVEKTKLAIAANVDFRRLRGVIEGFLRQLNKKSVIDFIEVDVQWALAAADILIDGKRIGTAGVASDELCKTFDLDKIRPCCAELDFEMLMSFQDSEFKIEPLAKFPAIERNLSIIVDEAVLWQHIVEVVNQKSSDKLEAVNFVEIYRGKNIPSGKKSVTLSMRFRDSDGTLTHQAVDELEQPIIDHLAKKLNSQLRTV